MQDLRDCPVCKRMYTVTSVHVAYFVLNPIKKELRVEYVMIIQEVTQHKHISLVLTNFLTHTSPPRGFCCRKVHETKCEHTINIFLSHKKVDLLL